MFTLKCIKKSGFHSNFPFYGFECYLSYKYIHFMLMDEYDKFKHAIILMMKNGIFRSLFFMELLMLYFLFVIIFKRKIIIEKIKREENRSVKFIKVTPDLEYSYIRGLDIISIVKGNFLMEYVYIKQKDIPRHYHQIGPYKILKFNTRSQIQSLLHFINNDLNNSTTFFIKKNKFKIKKLKKN